MSSKKEFGERVQKFNDDIQKIEEMPGEEGLSLSKKEFSESFMNLNEEMLGNISRVSEVNFSRWRQAEHV